jgi:hypothetical protein
MIGSRAFLDKATSACRPKHAINKHKISDYSFKPADGGLHQSPTRIPGPLLPTHTPMLRDALEIPVTLGRAGLSILAQHRG